MNNNHLQETARHYAQLAEQAQVDLQEADEINGELLGLIEALCEHFDLNMEELLEMAQTPARAAQLAAAIKRKRDEAEQFHPYDVVPDLEREHGELIGLDNAEKRVPLLFGKDGKVIRHLKTASIHGPTDAQPVDPKRPAARHGPTAVRPKGKGKGKGKGEGKNRRFDISDAILNPADKIAYKAKK